MDGATVETLVYFKVPENQKPALNQLSSFAQVESCVMFYPSVLSVVEYYNTLMYSHGRCPIHSRSGLSC